MNRGFALAFVLFACSGSTSTPPDGVGGSAGSGAIGGAAGVGGAAGAAATGGAAGSGGALCAQIAQEFEDALDAAKNCAPDSPTACSQAVDYSIESCGYYLYADASNTQALADLVDLRSDFASHGCDAPGTCAVGGWGPLATTCVPTGGGGNTGKCTQN